MTSQVFITDVTLRDGLQAESKFLSTEQKYNLFGSLSQMGYSRCEIASFVHPQWVPNLSDADTLCEKIFKVKVPLETMAFVPNVQGLERLKRFNIPWISTFIAASDDFNQKNVNQTVDESLGSISHIILEARRSSRKVRVYLSTVFGCPHQGTIAESTLERLFSRVAQLSPDEVALSDTIGVATPDDVTRVVNLAHRFFSMDVIALHLHDTYGMGLSCVQRGYDLGIRRFDGSTGGIGGCPFAKGATGNLAAESIAYLFFRLGLHPWIHVSKLKEAIHTMEQAGFVPKSSPIVNILRRGGTLYGC